jgi:putative phosphoesterase
MKYFIISDIHGSYKYLKKAIDAFNKSECNYLIILGDILYHGARNDLPDGYDTKKCLELLNENTDKIIAVRGNCDSEVDQMVLNFKMTADYNILTLKKRKVFLTHGHLYEDNLPKLADNDVYIQGHTHVLKAEKVDNIHYLNPGSIALPKENNPHTYAILNDNSFRIISFENEVIIDYSLN